MPKPRGEKLSAGKTVLQKSFWIKTAASPPDVRQGYALPDILILTIGLCPWFGLSPKLPAKGRTGGTAPDFIGGFRRQGIACLTPGGEAGAAT